MYHKIYIGAISLLIITLSLLTYNFLKLQNETKVDPILLGNTFGLEKKIITSKGEKLTCSAEVVDSKTGRVITSHKFILAVNNNCVGAPFKVSLTKEEYIKEIQNNPTWGIFDDDYNDPDITRP